MDEDMATLPQVFITMNEEWDLFIYITTANNEEQLAALFHLPKGTCEDTYDQEGNLVLNTESMVTTIDDDNTIGNDDHIDKDNNLDSSLLTSIDSIGDVSSVSDAHFSNFGNSVASSSSASDGNNIGSQFSYRKFHC